MRQTRVLCNDGRDRCMGALLDSVSFGSGPSRDDGAGAVRRGRLRGRKAVCIGGVVCGRMRVSVRVFLGRVTEA